MIVSCDKCHTKYRLSADEVYRINNSGRILKCGNCHHMWLVSPNLTSTSLHNVTTTPKDSTLIDRLKSAHYPSIMLKDRVADEPITDYYKHVPFVLRTYLATIIFLTVLAFALVNKNALWQQWKIVRPAFALAGLYDTKGLEFEKIVIEKNSFEEGRPLTISGYIINRSDDFIKIPDIRILLRNKDGEVVKRIIHKLPKKRLLPGEKTLISNRLKQYPADTYDIVFDLGNYLEFLIK